jgi:hypothetical protein
MLSKIMFPDTLYHYYEKTRLPFLSISELDPEKFSGLMDEFAALDILDNRFDEKWKRDFYLEFRPYVEKVIHDRFTEKGGRPLLKTPRYMTLGPATWFLDWYENPEAISIHLSSIPLDKVSFTFPDSMMSYLIAEDRYEPFAKYKMPYHGEVFTLDEIKDVIDEHGMPDEEDPNNIEHGNRIIEAQLWDLEILKEFV